jgi:hypothetical protein
MRNSILGVMLAGFHPNTGSMRHLNKYVPTIILTRYEFVMNTAFASQYVLGVNAYSAGNLRKYAFR